MRWDDFRRSDNVDDRRGEGGLGGGGGRMPVGRGGLGIGTIVVIGLIGWALGIDPRLLLEGASMIQGGSPYEQSQRAPAPRQTGAPKDEMGDFVAAVLGEIDDRWSEIFKEGNASYRGPRVVLFSGATNANRCGMAQSAMGPFYCPPDRQVFLDTQFFDEIEQRFRGCAGAPCKFTQAYILAHEVGHHVQNQLGILDKSQQLQRAAGSRAEANQIQVRVELQADCFAGVWANRQRQKRDYLDPGDVDAALQTAAAIGDDALQRKAGGRVVPDSFTHGSSEQRKRWFMNGFNSGKISACNTFGAERL